MIIVYKKGQPRLKLGNIVFNINIPKEVDDSLAEQILKKKVYAFEVVNKIENVEVKAVNKVIKNKKFNKPNIN